MNSTSPANSSVSTTAIVGGERGGGSGGGGGGSGGASSLEDFNFHPPDALSLQDCKEEAMPALRTELMAALNSEVKSLDEDNWMFEAPRSRIHLISRPSGFRSKMEVTKNKEPGTTKIIQHFQIGSNR